AKKHPQPPWMPFRNRSAVNIDLIDGIVVDVGVDFLEIREVGKQDAKRYTPHVLLSSGAVCHWETDCWCYLLDDVKKNDNVTIVIGIADKKVGVECFCLSINKRPGDVVPSSRKPDKTQPYHLKQQQKNERAAGGETKK